MAQTSDSLGPLLAAFLGNMSIALLKVTAAFFTGSSAMMAESVHSFADSGNQVLLYIGIKRAKRKPDALHPFGYGKESYFWSFLVSIGIFAGGSIFSIYHGIHNLTAEGHQPGNPIWAYGVLSGSIIFEGFAFMVAWKAFKKKHSGTGFFKAISEARDPVLFTVLLEDAGAMLGLIIALVGVFLAHQTGNHVYDAGASILIGTLLGLIAWMLAREVHSLILGESGHPELVAGINDVLENAPEIKEVHDMRTLQMGSNSLFVMIEAFVDASEHGGEIATACDAVEAQIHALNPQIRRVYLEAQGAEGLLSEGSPE